MTKPRGRRSARLLKLPPLPDAAAHARVLERLSRMSAEEIFETSVQAGIHRKDGKLTKAYRTPRDATSAAR